MGKLRIVRELWHLLRTQNKLWLTPLVVLLLLVGTVIVLAEGSVIAPFIYALF
jgi:hypothetical protein